jgi:hypothetical protein
MITKIVTNSNPTIHKKKSRGISRKQNGITARGAPGQPRRRRVRVTVTVTVDVGSGYAASCAHLFLMPGPGLGRVGLVLHRPKLTPTASKLCRRAVSRWRPRPPPGAGARRPGAGLRDDRNRLGGRRPPSRNRLT